MGGVQKPGGGGGGGGARATKTALRDKESPQFRVESCTKDDPGDPPCRAPPGKLIVGEGCRNRVEEEDEEEKKEEKEDEEKKEEEEEEEKEEE